MCSWSGAIPKLLCSASSASVSPCVSSLVMIASGSLQPADACIVRMCSMYSWRKHFSLSAMYSGSDTLIPLYPSRSPSPPATRTKAERGTAAEAPSASIFVNSSLPNGSFSPEGTAGLKPSKGVLPSSESLSNCLADFTYCASFPGSCVSSSSSCFSSAAFCGSVRPCSRCSCPISFSLSSIPLNPTASTFPVFPASLEHSAPTLPYHNSPPGREKNCVSSST
mmetsp:Transcript_23078/g.46710  ORF Transcript_23078/g.46710 Transcript_23078/m.46710 type:complete len:223 (+) Transcript_23078:1590-2258(+)